MLEEPRISHDPIIDCLSRDYGIHTSQITFLPLGADSRAAVYRAEEIGGQAYFVKLRFGAFDPNGVQLSHVLSGQTDGAVIGPINCNSGELWRAVDDYTLVLYPFVEGKDGYQTSLTSQNWLDFGRAVKQIHTANIPETIAQSIPREAYSGDIREQVRSVLATVPKSNLSDPISIELAAFLKQHYDEIGRMVNRAEVLALKLRNQESPFGLCHSDLHAGNILIDRDGSLFIVDWDNPVYAPKERDLMYPGGALGFTGHTSDEEEAYFFEGYGLTQIDSSAIAYYRTERVLADIASFCDEILSANQGNEDRAQSLSYLKSNFLPGSTIDRAFAIDVHV